MGGEGKSYIFDSYFNYLYVKSTKEFMLFDSYFFFLFNVHFSKTRLRGKWVFEMAKYEEEEN